MGRVLTPDTSAANSWMSVHLVRSNQGMSDKKKRPQSGSETVQDVWPDNELTEFMSSRALRILVVVKSKSHKVQYSR